MCLYDELVRVRGISFYTILLHVRRYLQCGDNLICVRVQAFIKQVSFRNRTLIYCTNEERHGYSAIGGNMSGESFLQPIGNQL